MTDGLSPTIDRLAAEVSTVAVFAAMARREAIERASAGRAAIGAARHGEARLERVDGVAWLVAKDRDHPHLDALAVRLPDLDRWICPTTRDLAALLRAVDGTLRDALAADGDPDRRNEELGQALWRCAERLHELLPLADARCAEPADRIDVLSSIHCATPWSDARFYLRRMSGTRWTDHPVPLDGADAWSRAAPSCVEIRTVPSSASGRIQAGVRLSIEAVRGVGPHAVHDAMSRLRLERDLAPLLKGTAGR